MKYLFWKCGIKLHGFRIILRVFLNQYIFMFLIFLLWDNHKIYKRVRFRYCWSSLVVQMVKHLPAMQETWVPSLGWKDPLEKEMATHSSTLAWKIPWREEPSRLQSMGSQRVRHDWVTSLHFIVDLQCVSFWYIAKWFSYIYIYIYIYIILFNFKLLQNTEYIPCVMQLDLLVYLFLHICMSMYLFITNSSFIPLLLPL